MVNMPKSATGYMWDEGSVGEVPVWGLRQSLPLKTEHFYN